VTFDFKRIVSNEANYLELYVDEERIWDVETYQAWDENPAAGTPMTYSAIVPAGLFSHRRSTFLTRFSFLSLSPSLSLSLSHTHTRLFDYSPTMFGAILMEDKAPGFEGSNTCSSVRIYMYVCTRVT
jgi:hypothetical protein